MQIDPFMKMVLVGVGAYFAMKKFSNPIIAATAATVLGTIIMKNVPIVNEVV